MSPRQRKLTQIRARRLQLEQSNRPKPKDWTGVIVIAIGIIITLAIFLETQRADEQAKTVFELDQRSHALGKKLGMTREEVISGIHAADEFYMNSIRDKE